MDRKSAMGLIAVMMAIILCTGCGNQSESASEKSVIEILNVSYDPTREFYAAHTSHTDIC